MIRNIVFDMGNVLVDYDGDLVCRALIPDEEKTDLHHGFRFAGVGKTGHGHHLGGTGAEGYGEPSGYS